MALKQAIRANKIKNYRKELEPLLARKEEIETTIRSAIEELESREFSDEELVDAEAVQTELEEEEKTLQERIDELEAKIAGLEEENRSEESEVENAVEAVEAEAKEEKREVVNMNKRQERIAYLNQDNVRDFYGRLAEAVKTRAVTNGDLLIPEEVIVNLLPMVAEQSKFYNEVNVVRLSGSGRAILEGANPEAVWTEMCDPIEELALAFSAVEVDGFKVGGYIPVCNAVLEDSLINLADYIESKLATAIAKALDKAIVVGTGTKQPTGIINGVAPIPLIDNKLSSILATMGELKDDNLGVVKIAMQRADYFHKVFDQLVGETAAGQMVMPNIAQANIAGIPIIFSDDVPVGGFIIGDFKKYLLAERSGTRFEVSRDVQFIQDNTVFKMTARYDGKPVDAEYFGYYNFAI